jgi:hypothetical protein
MSVSQSTENGKGQQANPGAIQVTPGVPTLDRNTTEYEMMKERHHPLIPIQKTNIPIGETSRENFNTKHPPTTPGMERKMKIANQSLAQMERTTHGDKRKN